MESGQHKVLLMGPGGSGKTSMRSIIFANLVAKDTSKSITPTVDVERSQIRFLGNLSLSLWDCGGQTKFLEGYIGPQKENVFRNVAVLIFVFDVKSISLDADFDDYCKIIELLGIYSPSARIYVLVHKMDLIPKEHREKVFESNRIRITQISLPMRVTCFQTSIWHDTLYRAWSTICASLVPQADLIQDHLQAFCENADIEEVVLFERATFLDIAHSSRPTPEGVSSYRDVHRFEKISNIIKMFKLSCLKARAQMQTFHLHMTNFDAFIHEFTSSTYLMVVVSDRDVKTQTTLMNISVARKVFEKLLTSSL